MRTEQGTADGSRQEGTDGAGGRAPERPLNVVLVEDHVALAKGIELILRRERWSVVGSTSSAEDAFELIARRRPHVAVVDIGLPGESGVELTERLLERDPELGVVLYTGLDDHAALVRGLGSGARGFALKAGPPEDLVEAVRSVGDGGTWVDPRLRPLVLDRSTTERIGLLSPRQREVLHLLAEGLTGDQIAQRLVLSTETVRTHIRDAMERLEAHTRVHAIAIALRQGELDL